MKQKFNRFIILFFLIAALLTSCTSVIDKLDLPDSPSPEPSQTPEAISTVSPTTVPIPSPSTTPEPDPAPNTFTLVAAGDIMAHSDNLKAALDPNTGIYDFNENYIHVTPIIKNADFSIVNLETVTAGPDSGYSSYPLFNTPASILDAINNTGFKTLVTANNHSLDRGKEGVLATINELEKRNILYTGTFKDPGMNYFSYDYEGYNINIFAYTQHLNGNDPLLDDDEKYMINVMNKQSIINDIQAIKNTSDLIIIYLHWGNEYSRTEESWQRDYALSLFEAGADVILGTHPHMIRPAETMIVDGEIKYVIYSMGNFISNFIRTDSRENALLTEDGVMVKLNFVINESGSFILSDVDHIPTWPYKYEDENGLHYEIIPISDPTVKLHKNEYADQEARNSYERTMEVLGSFTLD